MASSYPGALDNLGSMETHAHIGDAVDAVQAELGTDPAGTYDTDILAAVLTILDAAGIISDDTTGA